jgi:hypothetical protein
VNGYNPPAECTQIGTDLRLNLTLFTSAKDYTWVNVLQVWGIGTVDLAEQAIQVTAYSA